MDEDKISRLKAIADLRDSGILSEAEFQDQKTKIKLPIILNNHMVQTNNILDKGMRLSTMASKFCSIFYHF